MHGGRPKELAKRSCEGVIVSLLWHRADDRLAVLVEDTCTGERFRLPATRENALDVFYHPFAYVPAKAA